MIVFKNHKISFKPKLQTGIVWRLIRYVDVCVVRELDNWQSRVHIQPITEVNLQHTHYLSFSEEEEVRNV